MTSTLSQVPVVTAPVEPRAVPIAGAFDHVVPVSLQLFDATVLTMTPVLWLDFA